MNKPFSIARLDLTNQIAALVNECGLPASVIADILEKFLRVAEQLAEQELARDMELMEQQQKDDEKEQET